MICIFKHTLKVFLPLKLLLLVFDIHQIFKFQFLNRFLFLLHVIWIAYLNLWWFFFFKNEKIEITSQINLFDKINFSIFCIYHFSYWYETNTIILLLLVLATFVDYSDTEWRNEFIFVFKAFIKNLVFFNPFCYNNCQWACIFLLLKFFFWKFETFNLFRIASF